MSRWTFEDELILGDKFQGGEPIDLAACRKIDGAGQLEVDRSVVAQRQHAKLEPCCTAWPKIASQSDGPWMAIIEIVGQQLASGTQARDIALIVHVQKQFAEMIHDSWRKNE